MENQLGHKPYGLSNSIFGPKIIGCEKAIDTTHKTAALSKKGRI
jgi:hypothetical protein